MDTNTYNKLAEGVINKIKDFPEPTYDYEDSYNYNLTEEQKLLIDELIPNEELRERYKKYGLCKECKQPNTGGGISHPWCHSCNSKHFQQDFNKWTSDNKEINDFIQKFQLNATCPQEVLEWIPYEKLENVEYLAKGGFSTVYKAKWIDGFIDHREISQNNWNRRGNVDIVLKRLNNSQNLTADFLQEITFNKKINSFKIVPCYGISQDPETKNFMMVMEYIECGSLNQYLKNNYNKLSLSDKLELLDGIARGLKEIHNKGLVHKDLHSGNICCDEGITCYITDLGFSKPVDEQDETKIHGVLPYVAPEVLRNKIYTQAVDIYSFGVIACEILSGLPPYHNLPHDESLALKICQGLRPKLNNVKVPRALEILIDQCLDANPLCRPTADDLSNNLVNCWNFEDTDKYTNTLLNVPSYTTHPQAIYTSRHLDYKNLPEPQNSKETNDQFHSEFLSVPVCQFNQMRL